MPGSCGPDRPDPPRPFCNFPEGLSKSQSDMKVRKGEDYGGSSGQVEGAEKHTICG